MKSSCIRDLRCSNKAVSMSRFRLNIYGAMKEVGFRPFIYRLVKKLDPNGWMDNSPRGMAIEIEDSGRVININRIRPFSIM